MSVENLSLSRKEEKPVVPLSRGPLPSTPGGSQKGQTHVRGGVRPSRHPVWLAAPRLGISRECRLTLRRPMRDGPSWPDESLPQPPGAAAPLPRRTSSRHVRRAPLAWESLSSRALHRKSRVHGLHFLLVWPAVRDQCLKLSSGVPG